MFRKGVSTMFSIHRLTNVPLLRFLHGQSMFQYTYTRSLLPRELANETTTQFDTELQTKWQNAMDAGQFRYNLNKLDTKVIPGPHGYVGLLNVDRATQRRAPESMMSLNQEFDESKFHFGKVRDGEILMELREKDNRSASKDLLIINVSPVDFCHSLIVPEVEKKHTQNLTEHAITLALDLMFSSGTRSFRIAFNSLCAHASINHQHLHCYYADCELLAESVQGTRKEHGLFELDMDAPRGYGFELTDPSCITDTSRKLLVCTDEMRRSEIAHVVFICRGQSFTDSTKTAIRFLLWPRQKVIGTKPAEAAFNTAALEIAGHLLIKEKKYYDKITDELAYSCLRDCSIPADEFSQLTQRLTGILAKTDSPYT